MSDDHAAAVFPSESHPWVKQMRHAQAVLTRWVNLRGQDRCWHHPEILSELCATLGVPMGGWVDVGQPKIIPSRTEFEAGCRKYQDELYGAQPKKKGARS